MELSEVYKQIILEIKNSVKYYEDEDIDFIFNEDAIAKFKFLSVDSKSSAPEIISAVNSENSVKLNSVHKTITKQSIDLPKESRMSKINEQVMRCKRCSLYKSRNNTVLGEGSLDADILFIGEAPGENEDLTSRPFVGKAGELLVKIIENVIKVKREDVYMANILKCRPPGNRNPSNLEVSSCINYLHEQIKIINPKIIVPLGSVALSALLPRYNGITKNRGRDMILALSKENVYDVIPTYHPSYLLRGTPEEINKKKREVWADIKKIIKKLDL